MMFNNKTMDPTDPAFFEVARRLEAFADLRLSPSVAATTRMRANVVTAARRRAALMKLDPAFGAAGSPVIGYTARPGGSAPNEWRRPFVAVLAGALTLGLLVGTAYAGKPGGLLYAARVWTETANLPADAVARTNAEVARLDERLTEAQQAATAGDGNATEAALAAYTSILVEAATAATGDPAASAAIQLSVTRHVELLTVMADTVPAPARAAVEHALSSSTMVLRDLDGPDANGHHHDDGSGAHSAGNPTPAETPAPTPRPDRSHKPTETRRPGETAKPTEMPKPATTPQPDTFGRGTDESQGPVVSPAPTPTPRPGAAS